MIPPTAAAARWIYENNADNSARFVLGEVGANPLACMGVNPSTAAPFDLDLTVTKVREFARRNGFDGWVMLNLYPQRSTDPDCLHLAPQRDLAAENLQRIVNFIDGRKLTIVAAWGNLIASRPYLKPILAEMIAIPGIGSCCWVSLGPVLRTGHPRHPSRAAYTHALQPFDVAAYAGPLSRGPIP